MCFYVIQNHGVDSYVGPHLVLMLDCTPDFIMVSVPVGGLKRMVVPTGAAPAAAIPPNPVAPSVVPGCVAPLKTDD